MDVVTTLHTNIKKTHTLTAYILASPERRSFISGLVLASEILPTYAAYVGRYILIRYACKKLYFNTEVRTLKHVITVRQPARLCQRLALSITDRLTFEASKPTNPAAALLPGSLPNLVTARLMANAKSQSQSRSRHAALQRICTSKLSRRRDILTLSDSGTAAACLNPRSLSTCSRRHRLASPLLRV